MGTVMMDIAEIRFLSWGGMKNQAVLTAEQIRRYLMVTSISTLNFT